MITVPPEYSVVKRLEYEPSKWKGDTHNVTVEAVSPNMFAVERTAAPKARVPTITPFGVPVVPDV
jgi:hypothetical protein